MHVLYVVEYLLCEETRRRPETVEIVKTLEGVLNLSFAIKNHGMEIYKYITC